MYKLVVFATFLAVASAAPGLIGAPLSPYGAPLASYGAPIAPLGAHISPYGAIASPWGHGLYGSPLVSPVVKTALPVATSYANTVRVASPALVAPAPVIAAHGSLVGSPYAHGW